MAEASLDELPPRHRGIRVAVRAMGHQQHGVTGKREIIQHAPLAELPAGSGVPPLDEPFEAVSGIHPARIIIARQSRAQLRGAHVARDDHMPVGDDAVEPGVGRRQPHEPSPFAVRALPGKGTLMSLVPRGLLLGGDKTVLHPHELRTDDIRIPHVRNERRAGVIRRTHLPHHRRVGRIGDKLAQLPRGEPRRIIPGKSERRPVGKSRPDIMNGPAANSVGHVAGPAAGKRIEPGSAEAERPEERHEIIRSGPDERVGDVKHIRRPGAPGRLHAGDGGHLRQLPGHERTPRRVTDEVTNHGVRRLDIPRRYIRPQVNESRRPVIRNEKPPPRRHGGHVRQTQGETQVGKEHLLGDLPPVRSPRPCGVILQRQDETVQRKIPSPAQAGEVPVDDPTAHRALVSVGHVTVGERPVSLPDDMPVIVADHPPGHRKERLGQ